MTLSTHIQLNAEKDAGRFLNDQTSIVPVDYQPPDRQTPLEALTDCFLSAKLMRHNNVLGALRHHFRILLVGDMAVTLYGKKGQIKEHQLVDLEAVVRGKYTSMTEREKFSAELVGVEEPTEALMDLKRVVNRGAKLVFFCSKFGTGSLFWLYSLFNDHL